MLLRVFFGEYWWNLLNELTGDWMGAKRRKAMTGVLLFNQALTGYFMSFLQTPL